MNEGDLRIAIGDLPYAIGDSSNAVGGLFNRADRLATPWASSIQTPFWNHRASPTKPVIPAPNPKSQIANPCTTSSSPTASC